MIKINMFSAAEKVPGQGVASAYRELINLMHDRLSDKYEVQINRYGRSDISHYHTINVPYFLSTFMPNRGRKIGYVHFLPETLKGSLKLPGPIRWLVGWYVMTFYKRMGALVVVNPSFIDDLVAAGVDREKVTYIPNFVNPANFYPLIEAEQQAFRAANQIPAQQPVILGVGQVQERKGVFDFIELAKANPDWLFIWAGGFSFGAMTEGYEALKKVVENPPRNLRFPGILPREELNNYYNIADIFLLPSFAELFPMSALEAFSTHTPVVLRDLELYRSVMDGYYAAAKDRAGMQEQLAKILNEPATKKHYQQLSQQASEYYSPASVAKLWDRYYTQQYDLNQRVK